jgi:hypothetical protein
MMNFSSMLNAPVATRPVEDLVAHVISEVRSVAEKNGYHCTAKVNSSNGFMEDELIILVTFTINKQAATPYDQTTHASIQVRVPTTGYAHGAARLCNAQGFSSEFGPLLRNLQAAPSRQEDAQGVQAVQQNNPAQAGGRSTLEAGPNAPTPSTPQPAGNSAVAAMAVASLDVATMNRFLKRGEKTRRYIGSSGIGEKCMAYHALSLRGFPSDVPEPKMIRIFDQGHRIETEVVEMLKAAGHQVFEVDPLTHEQWEYTSHGGHHVCHLDGFIALAGSTERMTLEVKSMNKAMFTKFQKVGVQLSHPHYYDQVQDQLQLSGTERCFFIAYCKDNSDYHVEIVERDQKQIDLLSWRVHNAVTGSAARAGAHANEYDCKQCFKHSSCWTPDVEDRKCWHCAHSKPVTDGAGKRWYCTLSKAVGVEDICSSFKLFRPAKKGTP